MDPLPLYRVALPFGAVVAMAVLCLFHRSLRLRAMLLGIVMMVGYAVVQDQVSARLCPEYFTVFHNPIPGLTDPTLVGIVWGFVGSCWGGAIMGYAAGLVATLGPRPPLTVRQLVIPMLLLTGAIALVTLVAGLTAYRHAVMFDIRLDPVVLEDMPIERHHYLFTVACYHLATYVTAVVGTVILCIAIARSREPHNLNSNRSPH